MRSLMIVLALLPWVQATASSRYLTWVDDLGRVHNTFVDNRFAEQQGQAKRRAEQSDQTRLGDGGAWPGSAPSTWESKRRYFTWVDGNGQLQNSFYAGAQIAGASDRDQVLATGERAGEYIDSAVLEGRGFTRGSYDSPYYTWVDEQGRTHNSPVPTQQQASASSTTASSVRYSEGRQIEFERSKPSLPMLDGQPSAAMQALLEAVRRVAKACMANCRFVVAGNCATATSVCCRLRSLAMKSWIASRPVSTSRWGAVITLR